MRPADSKVLYRFSKFEWLERSLKFGEFRLVPASYIRTLGGDSERYDDEQERNYEINAKNLNLTHVKSGKNMPLLSNLSVRTRGVPKHESPDKFREWLDSNLVKMTLNSTNRELNQIVAVQLYPIFQKKPSLWKAIELLNQNPHLEGDFQSYLQCWHNTVAVEYRVSVRNISSELGYHLQSNT